MLGPLRQAAAPLPEQQAQAASGPVQKPVRFALAHGMRISLNSEIILAVKGNRIADAYIQIAVVPFLRINLDHGKVSARINLYILNGNRIVNVESRRFRNGAPDNAADDILVPVHRRRVAQLHTEQRHKGFCYHVMGIHHIAGSVGAFVQIDNALMRPPRSVEGLQLQNSPHLTPHKIGLQVIK